MALDFNSLSQGNNEDARILITKGTDGAIIARRWHPIDGNIGSVAGQDTVLPPQVDSVSFEPEQSGMRLGALSVGTDEDARMLITAGNDPDDGTVLFRRNHTTEVDVGSVVTMDATLPPTIDEVWWNGSEAKLRLIAFDDPVAFSAYANRATHSVHIAFLDTNGDLDMWSQDLISPDGIGHHWLRLLVPTAEALNTALDNFTVGTQLLIVFAQTGSVGIVDTSPAQLVLETLVDGRFFEAYRSANLNAKSMFVGYEGDSGQTTVAELPLDESAIEASEGAYNLVWDGRCMEWGDSVLKWGVPDGA